MPLVTPPSTNIFFEVSVALTEGGTTVTRTPTATAVEAELTAAKLRGRIDRYSPPELEDQFLDIPSDSFMNFEVHSHSFPVPTATYHVIGAAIDDWRYFVGSDVTINIQEVLVSGRPDVMSVADAANVLYGKAHKNVGVLTVDSTDEFTLEPDLSRGTLFRQRCPVAGKAKRDADGNYTIIERWDRDNFFLERNGVDVYSRMRTLYGITDAPTKLTFS